MESFFNIDGWDKEWFNPSLYFYENYTLLTNLLFFLGISLKLFKEILVWDTE